MNIKQAKEQIKNAMTAYFSKNEFGWYEIPPEKQRPIFLLGAPGIGKTAIMEQIATELNVGLVSYSMTHHTRQSALGLPFIEKKLYGGKEYNVSEYTMSEIIASVYDVIENTGHKEGILFLDEINCVSETLSPAMLQFLQYKIFGRHKVPDGWIVVTAGNPPEYNNSVHEFDIVTWDRLKKIEVEPDYSVWKEYAINIGTHPAIISYLDIKRGDFYKIETTVDGKHFVTARGWSDLSDMIKLYEKHGITVDNKLVSQYIQHPKIAKEFSIYYDLFNKYKSDYQVDKIIEGKANENILNRAKSAKFDERLALLGLLINTLINECSSIYFEEETLGDLVAILKLAKSQFALSKNYGSVLENFKTEKRKKLEQGKDAHSMSTDTQKLTKRAIDILEQIRVAVVTETPQNATAAFAIVKRIFDDKVKALDNNAGEVEDKLTNVFKFCDSAFGDDSQELLVLVTELTMNHYVVYFISHHNCEEYFKHNKQLMFYERQIDIIRKIEMLDVGD